jgi:hypothetical protein
MNATQLLDLAWNVLNSPAVIAALAAALLWGLNRIYARRPTWQAFEGTIIAAVKWAEKTIPDSPGEEATSGRKSLARLDAALKYVLDVYEQARGRGADEKTAAELREGIQIVHAQLEAQGTLGKGEGGRLET